MKTVRIIDTTPPRQARLRAPVAGPVVVALGIAGAALTAAAFFTIVLLLSGFALAAFLVWRVSGWLPGRRASTTQSRHPGPDRRAFEAYMAARAEAARPVNDPERPL